MSTHELEAARGVARDAKKERSEVRRSGGAAPSGGSPEAGRMRERGAGTPQP